MIKRIPISPEHRRKLPLPTGNYDEDARRMAIALTDAMIPPTPDGFRFVQWEVDPPDTAIAVFESSVDHP